MRVLDVSDGFTASGAPTAGVALAGGLSAYATDAAYVLANGTPAGAGQGAYWDTTLSVIKVYDGSSWIQCVTGNGAQQLTNKDYDGGTASNARRLTVPKSTFAAISALTRKEATLWYATDRAKLYLDSGSAIRALGGGGGGSALLWLPDEAGASPLEEILNNERTFRFEAAQTQSLYAVLKVPDSYNAGDQLKLRIAAYSASTSNNFLLTAVATLIRKNTDAVTSTTNTHTSINTALTNSGSTNVYREIELDLTGTDGTVNSVAVAAGDFIKIRIRRGTDTDTADIYWLPDLSEVLLS